jgi:flagellar hook-associated protein FlgK
MAEEQGFPNELQAIEVSNESLTKAQLLEKVNMLEKTLTQIQEQLQNQERQVNEHLKEVYEDCNKRIEAANNLIAYQDRKLKMIGDLVNLEGEK